MVCGARIENVEDPLMRAIRDLEQLINDLARGGAMQKILGI